MHLNKWCNFLFPKNIVNCRILTHGQYATQKISEKFNKFCLPIDFDKILTKQLQVKMVLTPGEWKKFRQNLLQACTKNNYVNETNVDSILLGYCEQLKSVRDQMENVKHYIEALNLTQTTPSLTSFSKILNIYYRKATQDAIDATEEDQLLQLCQFVDLELKKKPNRDVFRSLLLAISITKEWRKVLNVIESQKETGHSIGKPPAVAYKIFIANAFNENDAELGWKLLNEINEKNILPDAKVFTAYWGYCRRFQADLLENIDKMLEFIRANDLIIQKEVIDGLVDLIRDAGQVAEYVELDKSDVCKNCDTALCHSVEINSNEFSTLQHLIKELALKDNGIFSKTSPEELQKFSTLISERSYDVVIDGFGISLSDRRISDLIERTDLITDTIKHFAENNKQVLVLGRKSMELWPKRALSAIEKNAALYLIDEYSKHDPFMLYAAIMNKSTCDMLTTEFPTYNWLNMLSRNDQAILSRWQQQHQFILRGFDKFGHPLIDHPLKYDIRPHKVDNYWHIPYLVNSKNISQLNELIETPKNWICIKKF